MTSADVSSIDTTIERMIRNYPSLFANRTQALGHLLCVLGNGYQWDGGELVSVFEERERTDEDVQWEVPKWATGDIAERYAADNLRFLDIRRRAAELARTPGPLERAVLEAGHYLLPEPLPKDARPEWRSAAAEYEATVRQFHEWWIDDGTIPVNQVCNARSPHARVDGREPASYPCLVEGPQPHDDYHRNGNLTWRDPEPMLGEPKPWHPDHRPHVPANPAIG